MKLPRPSIVVFVLAAGLCVPSCKRKDPLYCDENTMCLEGYEACDLTGACTELRNTCLAPEDVCWDAALQPVDGAVDAFLQICTPDAFLRCDGNGDVVACNSSGSAEVTLSCDSGCNEAAMGCNDCEPSTSECVGDVLTVCSSTGAILSMDTCPLGCHTGGTRCNDLAPSNGLGVYLDEAPQGPDLVLLDGSTIDTATGVVMSGGSPVTVPSTLLDAPAGGVQVRVFKVASFRCGDLSVTGGPALAIVSDRDIDVLGHLVLDGLQPPGAFDGSSTCHGIDMDTDTGFAGAGGGGYGGPGAAGGSAGTTAGRAGGMTSGNVTVVPLRGGCWGGTVSNFYPQGMLTAAIGGWGGGAAQLASRTRIRIGDVNIGSIQANGRGGRDGPAPSGGGAGGGSGGGILLEAPVVTIAAASGLTANGGAGSCSGMTAPNGSFSLSPATGASCSGDAGDGGNGGTGASTPGTGGNGTGTGPVGGGGGGTIGRVRINTANGIGYSADVSSIVSPEPSVGTAAIR